MANETILIVDADEKSQRVLEVSFKKAGYRVVMTDSVIQALEYVHAVRPDIIISDTQFPDGTDGFDFIEAIKADPNSTTIPFLFLTEERALDRKMKGFEAGADDYLTKPVYIKEVTTRVELLLQKRAKEILTQAESDEFEGKLSDITMIDLLQMIEGGGRSGSIDLRRDDRTGVVTFREGNIYDAICGKLQGEEAIYRLLLWPDGDFTVRYHDDVGSVDQIGKESGELLLEGIRRLERWNDQIRDLPPLGSTLESDFSALAKALEELPSEVGRVARLFDGVRTIRDVVDDSPFDDVTSLQITRRLLNDGILQNVTPAEVNPEEATPANLAAWLEGKDRGRVRQDTSPGTLSTTAGNDRPRRETEQLETEDPWKRRKTERIETSEASEASEATTDDPRQTNPGLTTRTAETPAARAPEISEAEELEQRRVELSGEGGEAGDEDSDWKFHFDDIDADDAIRRIEEEERRRRELEAQQLFEERESSGTLQQTPAVSRESGEVQTPTEELEAARAEANAAEDAAISEARSAGPDSPEPEVDQALSELEEAERRRRELEAQTLERQRQLAEETRRRLMDGSPRLPGAQTETTSRPETPSSGVSAVETTEPQSLERQTDELHDESSREAEDAMSDRRRARRATPISAPALVSSKAVALDDDEDRPRAETPHEPTPAEQREAAVEEAEAVAREASEDVRQSAPHAAVDISEVVDEADEPAPQDAAHGLGTEVSEADAFEDDEPAPGSTYDEVVAVSAFESSTPEDEEDLPSTERTTKRMRQPNFAALTPLGEEVSEPVVGDDDDLASLDENTEPGPEPAVIEAQLEALPPVERHSHDNEIVRAEYDLSETSRRRREVNQHGDESPEARKARIEEAAERAANKAIKATTGLDPADFVPPYADDPDTSTEVWDPQMMSRVDEIAEAWANAPDSEIADEGRDYDLIDVSEAEDTPVDGDQESIDIDFAEDTDPPVDDEVDEDDDDAMIAAAAAAAAAEDVSELETVELDEEEKAGVATADTEPADEAEPAEAEPEDEVEPAEDESSADEADETSADPDEDEQADDSADEEGAEAEGEEGEGLAEGSDAEELADNSSEVSFFADDFEPESYEYPEEDDQPKWMLGIAAFLMLLVVGFVVVIATSGSDGEGEGETTQDDTVAEVETTETTETTPETTPVETTPTEVAGLSGEEAEVEAASNGLDVQESAAEVSMLLAGIDPLMQGDAGLADVPDAGVGELAVNTATETTPDAPANDTTPSNTTDTPDTPDTPPAAATPEDEVREAEKLVNREQFSKAIDKLKELANSQPDNGRVPYLHGIAAVSIGRSGEAITQFERAKRLGYRPAKLFIELGGAYFIEGNKPKAKEAYEQFLEKQPNGDEADQVRTILQTQF